MKQNTKNQIILLLKNILIIASMLMTIKFVFYSILPIIPILVSIFLLYIILKISDDKRKTLFDSFLKMLMVIIFSVFPIGIILITNYTINPTKFNWNIITYSLLIGSIYSCLTPSIVNLIF